MQHLRLLTLASTLALAACQPSGSNAENSQPAHASAPTNSAAPKEATSMPNRSNARLDEKGELSARVGDVTLSVKAGSCQEDSPGITLCNGAVNVSLSHADGNPIEIKPDALYVNSEATLYHGPLDEQAAQAGYTALLSDVDGDGHDDLVLRTGKEGNYGGASYSVYLYDATSKRYAISQEFSDLTVLANGLFTVKDGSLTASSTDGCCLHVFDKYEIRDRNPVLVERVTEDSTDPANPTTSTQRLVNGELKEVAADK